MEKPIFYCDCDGVILNTIEIAFKIMERDGCDIKNRQEVDRYFKKLIDWNEIFLEVKVINDSINQLRYLKDQKIFDDVIILTKLSGSYDEARLKREFFSELLPDIRIITLQYGLSKATLPYVKNNILLDDEIKNCEEWERIGTPVLFSQEGCNLEKNIVNNISDVVNTDGVKKLLKTRNF